MQTRQMIIGLDDEILIVIVSMSEGEVMKELVKLWRLVHHPLSLRWLMYVQFLKKDLVIVLQIIDQYH